MTYLVAFVGLPRAGKGTAAAPLVARGFFQASFAEELYREVAAAFGVRIDELRSNEWKTEPVNLLSIRSCSSTRYRAMLDAAGESMSAPRTSRYHLQRWATEYRRRQEPNYWVRQLENKVTTLSRGVNIVIDDLRFPETEYVFIRAFAALTQRELRIIEIVRPGNTHGTDHVSDKPFPQHLIDNVIENIPGHPGVLQNEVVDYLYPTGK